MKRSLIIMFATAFYTQVCMADSLTRASEASLLSTVTVVASASLVVGSTVLEVLNTSKSSTHHKKVDVKVKNTKNGTEETVSLPRDIIEKAQIKKGDNLTVKPTKTGAVLSKNDTPIAYLVTPENANLTRSHELAR